MGTDGQKTDSKIDPKINAQNEVPEASKDLQGGPPSAPGCSFRPHREPPSSKKHENTKENQCFSRVPKSPPWRLRGLPLPPLEPPWTPKVAQRVPKEPQRLPFGAQIWSKFGHFLVLFSAGSPRPPKCPPGHQNDAKLSPEPQKSFAKSARSAKTQASYLRYPSARKPGGAAVSRERSQYMKTLSGPPPEAGAEKNT